MLAIVLFAMFILATLGLIPLWVKRALKRGHGVDVYDIYVLVVVLLAFVSGMEIGAIGCGP